MGYNRFSVLLTARLVVIMLLVALIGTLVATPGYHAATLLAAHVRLHDDGRTVSTSAHRRAAAHSIAHVRLELEDPHTTTHALQIPPPRAKAASEPRTVA